MMAALLGILTCRPIRAVEGRIKLTSDDRMLSKKSQSINATKSKVEDLKYRLRCESTATSIVNVLLNAETVNPTLGAEIASLVHKKAGGWSVYLATKVLYSVETVLRARQVLNGAMKVARDKAYEAARVFESFRAEDPAARAVFMAVIAIGVLVILAPYMIELLGFAEMGPVQGTWAALLQSTYRGFVPKQSLFSFFQRLEMTYRLVWKGKKLTYVSTRC